MANIPITPTVLRWAIDTSGLADSEIANRAGVSEPRLASWLAGSETPSLTQFKKLAEAVKRPTATLLLPVPPSDYLPSVQFRSAADADPRPLNRKELLKLREIARLQRGLIWVASELADAPADLSLVDANEVSPAEAADHLRSQLSITPEQQLSWQTDAVAFKAWREALERMGIYVMLASLGNDAVKGFSLWDPLCPVVVVNTHWNNPARSFTLFHELAHLLTRTNSMCAADAPRIDGGDKFERWCESFAADFLLPWPAVTQFMIERGIVTAETTSMSLAIAKKVASAFKVSLRATALKFIEQGVATWELYRLIPPAADAKAVGGGGGGGRKRPQIRLDEYGRRTALMFGRGVDHDAIGTDDALSYLAVSDAEFDELRKLAASALP